jgi:hypothetical protein
MNDATTQLLLPGSWPALAVVAMAAGGVFAWVAMHALVSRPRERVARAGFYFARAAVAAGAVWLVFNALIRAFTTDEHAFAFATSWPLWVAAVVAGLATELVITLYRLERRTLRPFTGLVLGALRLAMVLLVILMLVQPVFSWFIPRKEERVVAVLLDDSASMHLVDRQATTSEKLALAQLLLPDAAKQPFRVDRTIDALQQARNQVAAQADWIGLVKDADFRTLAAQIDRRRETMAEQLAETAAIVNGQLDSLNRALAGQGRLDPAAKKELDDIRSTLKTGVRDRLQETAELSRQFEGDKIAARARALFDQLREAQKALSTALRGLPALAVQVDDAHFASLPVDRRKAINQAARASRRAIARAVLATGGEQTPTLLDAIVEKYTLRFYRFASRAEETDARRWQTARDEGNGAPSEQPVSQQATDLAGVLEQVRTDVPAATLAGVLVVSDGRHNVTGAVEPVARWLALHHAPAGCVLVGSLESPPDAAVTGLICPPAVMVEDRLLVRAGIKLDGLAGREAEVGLFYKGQQIDTRKVKIPAATFRTVVELGDTPKEKGIREYEVRVKPFDGEWIQTNNARTTHVSVTDERTRMLLIEERPRWEFRYIRNLFMGRDRSVQLQHVLFKPDWIKGAKPRQVVHASVSRPEGDVEASALPEDEAEWLQFDVIVLGDVSPDHLTREHIRILEKFVGERGGRLVVIAGPQFMPHAFADTTLKDIIPVVLDPQVEPSLKGPEPRYRVALTEAGREHVITQQDKDPQENLAIWEQFPDIHWRYPIAEAKPGATVLAFAMEPDPPDIFRPPDVELTPSEAERIERERTEYQNRRALIVLHRYALGRVLMLTFDHTWRFRYRKGDTHHHKFWGQVLRWATADKLPAGTGLARLGTDRRLYTADEPIVVRAKLLTKEHKRVVSERVSAAVYHDNVLVQRKSLDYIPNSAGMYEADLGRLRPGKRYRIALEVDEPRYPDVTASAANVSTDVMVTPVQSSELVELSADPSVLARLAQLSGGSVVRPAEARSLLDAYGPGTRVVQEERNYALWKDWPLLVIMGLTVTAEWTIRKKVGLT